MSMHRQRTLLVLTNIPTPYRTNFFNHLSRVMAEGGKQLVVAYCAKSEWHRHWPFVPEENRYRYVFLRGLSLKVGALTFHINPSVIGLIRTIRPTWLLSAGAWNMPTGLMALSLRPFSKLKAVFWSEGHADAVLHKAGIFAALRRIVLRRYDAFAIPNARSARFLASELGGAARCLPLPNTVDDEFFRKPPEGERDRIRRALGIRPEERLVVQVSRMEDRKGVRELCAAIAGLANECPGLRVAIIGTGTLESELRGAYRQELESGCLIFPGSLDAKEVRNWLYAGDVFILTSRRDPNPLSSIEAALCGLPLILSRFVGNVDEFINPSDRDWIIDEISPGAIANALKCFATRPELEIQEAARKCAEKARAFESKSVATNFAQHLDLILGTTGRDR